MAIKKKPVKKTVKPASVKTSARRGKNPEGKLVGKISHYFSNIEVAVVELSSPLKVGDIVRVIGGQETDFNQKVDSMQIEHEQVKLGKKGDSVGMKVKEKVHEGYKVFKV